MVNHLSSISVTVQTRKWHSESADPAKALDLSLTKQTDKQKILATQGFELSTLAFLAQCSYRLIYRDVLICVLLSDDYYQITIIRLTKNFGHTEVRTLDPRVFSTMLLPTELQGRTNLITLIRLLLSDYYYPGSD